MNYETSDSGTLINRSDCVRVRFSVHLKEACIYIAKKQANEKNGKYIKNSQRLEKRREFSNDTHTRTALLTPLACLRTSGVRTGCLPQPARAVNFPIINSNVRERIRHIYMYRKIHTIRLVVFLSRGR